MIFVPIFGSKTKKVELVLDKEGEEKKLLVVFAGKGEDVIDLDLSSIHKSPSTKGRVIVRGILKDSSYARIRGLIKIEKDAQMSEDFLEEKTLLIGKESKVETFPYLEIEADDVRASHAATISVVDEEQLFYLRSRGLKRSQATELIIEGFLQGVLDEFDEDVSEGEKKQLQLRLEKVKSYALG